MTLQERVEVYTGSVAQPDQLSVWLSEAAKVLIELIPDEIADQYAQTAEISGGQVNVADRRVLRVKTNTGYGARWIPPEMQAQVSDPDSIHAATPRSPAYFIESGTLRIYPTDAAGRLSYLEAPAVSANSVTVSNFPSKLTNSLVLYAATQNKIRQMHDVALKIGDLRLDIIVPPAPPLSPQHDYLLGAFGVPPTYTTGIPAELLPVLNISDISTPTATFPSAPVISLEVANIAVPAFNVNIPDVSLDLQGAYNSLIADEDIELTRATVESILARLTGAKLEAEVAVAQLNAVQAQYGIEELKVRMEIAKLEAYRTEIGAVRDQWETYRMQIGARIDEFSAKLSKWSTEAQVKIQDNLNKFNEKNVEYQANIQRAIEIARQERDTKVQEYADKLQRYSAEISQYGTKIQEYMGNYQTSLQRLGAEHSVRARELEVIRREYNQSLYLALGVTQPGVSTAGEPIEQ